MKKTLRDEFAMAAITGLLGNEIALGYNEFKLMKHHDRFSSLIFLSYSIADEMLIERETKRDSRGFQINPVTRKKAL